MVKHASQQMVMEGNHEGLSNLIALQLSAYWELIIDYCNNIIYLVGLKNGCANENADKRRRAQHYSQGSVYGLLRDHCFLYL